MSEAEKLVEEVAKAARESKNDLADQGDTYWKWEELPEGHRVYWRHVARAAMSVTLEAAARVAECAVHDGVDGLRTARRIAAEIRALLP